MSPAQKNFLIGGLIIAVAGIVQLLPQNSCEKSSNKLLVLIDQTDQLSDKSLESIQQHAKQAINASLPYTNVVVKYISDGKIKKRYEGCRPEKVEWYTQVFADDQKLDKQWRRFVSEFLSQLTAKVENSDSSPIYESVIDDARMEFVDYKNKEMLVFSDFREYTKNKVNLQTKCLDASSESHTIINTLPTITQAGSESMRPLDGVNVKRFIIPRESMSKSELDCLVTVSDMVFQNMMSSASILAPMGFLPTSP
jgi:hypothetical protein